jgi:hypothetical protein
VEVPDVSYAWSGDVAIAYQTVGEGPEDLVFLPFLANIYTLWQVPRFAEFGRRLVTGRRVIVVNPRGIGLSDRPRGFTVDSRMDDIHHVRDEGERISESIPDCEFVVVPGRGGAMQENDYPIEAIEAFLAGAAQQRIPETTGPARAIADGRTIVELARSIGLDLAGTGEVLVSSTVKDLVAGSGIGFDDRGSHELKGVPGEWSLYAVRNS